MHVTNDGCPGGPQESSVEMPRKVGLEIMNPNFVQKEIGLFPLEASAIAGGLIAWPAAHPTGVVETHTLRVES